MHWFGTELIIFMAWAPQNGSADTNNSLQVKKTLITWAGDFPMTAMPAKALRLGLPHWDATAATLFSLQGINRGPNHRIGRQIPAPFVFCFIFWSRDRSKGDTGYQWYQMRLQSFGWCSGNLKLHYIIKNWLVWLFCGRATFLVRFRWSLPHERRKCRLGWRRAEGLSVSGVVGFGFRVVL